MFNIGQNYHDKKFRGANLSGHLISSQQTIPNLGSKLEQHWPHFLLVLSASLFLCTMKNILYYQCMTIQNIQFSVVESSQYSPGLGDLFGCV